MRQPTHLEVWSAGTLILEIRDGAVINHISPFRPGLRRWPVVFFPALAPGRGGWRQEVAPSPSSLVRSH